MKLFFKICILSILVVLAGLFNRGLTHAQTVSTLQMIADAMPEGTWAEVTGSNINSGALRCLGANGCLGNTSFRMAFAQHMAWDDERSVLSYIGADHGEPLNATNTYGGVHTDALTQYDEASNFWSLICGGGNMVSTPCGGPTTYLDSAHGYNHTAVDSRTGAVFHGSFGSGINNAVFDRYPIGGPFATPFFNGGSALFYQTSLQWWPGTTVAGSDYGGSLVWYNCGPGGPVYGQMLFISPAQNAGAGNAFQSVNGITNVSGGTPGNSSAQCVSVFSDRYQRIIYGGGTSDSSTPPNADIKRLWYMGSDLVPHELPSSPVVLGVTQGNMEVDPVSGNLIIIGDTSSLCTGVNHVYEFDFRTNAYTEQIGTRLPPPSFPDLCNSQQLFLSVAMPRHGVIAYVFYAPTGDQLLHMFLYKHKNPETFAQRCAHPEVQNCQGFEDDSVLQHWDSLGGGMVRPMGLHDDNPATYGDMTRDTTVHSDGISSLKLNIPAVAAGGNTSNHPYWYTNGHFDYSGQYGTGQQFWMSWRQLMDTNYVTNKWTYGGGFNPGGRKQAAFGQGDMNNTLEIGICTAIDVAFYDQRQVGAPGLEQGCGRYAPINQPFYPPGCVGGACTDQTIQNAVADPGCLYRSPLPGYQTPNNCFLFANVANKWVANKAWVKFGPVGGSTDSGQTCNPGVGTGYYCNTQFKQWVQVEGEKRWRLIMSMSGITWLSLGQTVGKFFLQGQNTHECGNEDGLHCDVANPVSNIWFDEFTLSNADIAPFAAPNAVVASPPALVFTASPSNVMTGGTFAPTVVVAAQSGGITDATFSGNIALVMNACGASSTGTATRAATAGVATFTGLGASGSGTSCSYTATATGYTSVVSSIFNVTGGGMDTMAFSSQPGSIVSGSTFSPPVQVTVSLPGGGTDSSFTGNILLSMNTCGAATIGTFNVAAVAGVATFSGLGAMNAATGCTLTGNNASIASVTSNPFNVTTGVITATSSGRSALRAR